MYDKAAHTFMELINQYELIEKNFPDENVQKEKGMMYLNASLCMLKIKHYQDAATAAEEACICLPKNYKVHVHVHTDSSDFMIVNCKCTCTVVCNNLFIHVQRLYDCKL